MSLTFDPLRLGYGKPDDNERIYNTALSDAEAYLRDQPDPRDAEIARLNDAFQAVRVQLEQRGAECRAAEAQVERLKGALEYARGYVEGEYRHQPECFKNGRPCVCWKVTLERIRVALAPTPAAGEKQCGWCHDSEQGCEHCCPEPTPPAREGERE